ncbi:MAG: hypothetical protein VX934_03665, partial [Cyanobacteriota bacterium]|nr:hypothetical protein [Cyanobacteriota bacterium]
MGGAQNVAPAAGDELGVTATQQRAALGANPKPSGTCWGTAVLPADQPQLPSRGLAWWIMVVLAVTSSGSRFGLLIGYQLIQRLAEVGNALLPAADQGSALGAVLEQAHQHLSLMIVPPKEHGQNLDFSLLRA